MFIMPHCSSLGVQSVQAVFRSLASLEKTVEKCHIELDGDKNRLTFTLHCKHGTASSLPACCSVAFRLSTRVEGVLHTWRMVQGWSGGRECERVALAMRGGSGSESMTLGKSPFQHNVSIRRNILNT